MSANSSRTPRDLAHIVATRLGFGIGVPGPETLDELFEALFLASLKSEEGRPIRSLLAFASPRTPDPHPPPHVRLHRWIYVPFASPVPLGPESLAKLALASDPLTSALAVYCKKGGRPQLHGLFDQQHAFQASLRYEGDGGFMPPGLFQVQILGIGHLGVMQDWAVLGELCDGLLAPATQEVLASGPVFDLLAPSIVRFLTKVRSHLQTAGFPVSNADEQEGAYEWTRALRRLLARSRVHGRGACFLLVEAPPDSDLRPSYSLHYRRITEALEAVVQNRRRERALEGIIDSHLEPSSDSVPADLHLELQITSSDLEDAEEALDGAIDFVATLSRVDGAVILTSDLAVLGFGAEILAPDSQVEICLARSPRPRGRRHIDLSRTGTRHRSAIRYCAAHHNALACVVSEDGPVRAVRWQKGRVWLWDNVQLMDVQE